MIINSFSQSLSLDGRSVVTSPVGDIGVSGHPDNMPFIRIRSSGTMPFGHSGKIYIYICISLELEAVTLVI